MAERDAEVGPPLAPETLDRLRAQSRPLDVAEFLGSPEDVAGYLDEALATGDPIYFAYSLGVVARAQRIGR